MAETKLCKTCRLDKEHSEFTADKSKVDGLARECRECKNARMRQWAQVNPKKDEYKRDTTERSREYRRKAFKDKRCINCNLIHDTGGLRCKNCARLHADQVTQCRRDARRECFEAYGGPKCACCGETEYRFLTIDHVNDNGAHHRRSITGCNGGALYTWLRARRFPPGYAVLCYNCNCGRALNNGICPHKTKSLPLTT